MRQLEGVLRQEQVSRHTKCCPGNVHTTGSGSIESDVFELLSSAAEVQEVFAAVQHTSKAREDEDFLLFFHDQLIDDLIKYDKFG